MAHKLNLHTTIPAQPTTIRGNTCQLTASPCGTKLLYPSGNNLIIRDIETPSKARVFAEHGKRVTIGRFSPNGQWIASADETGKIKIWSEFQEEENELAMKVKYDYHMLGGEIKDLAWDGESKRIVCAGDGRGQLAKAFIFDTGSNVGEFAGVSKRLNTCDFRNVRPFRAVVGSDDFSTAFYAGPPFKFQKSNSDHSQLVTCTRFSPDGAYFASSSTDGKIVIYEGKEGEKLFELGSHQGGCYAVDWDSTSNLLVSASADKTVKVWDILAKQEIACITVGSEIGDQQLGVVWTSKDQIISVSLDGTLNYIDYKNGKVGMRVFGHMKAIGCVEEFVHCGKFMTASSFDGSVRKWSVDNYFAEPVEGTGHKGNVLGLHQSGTGGFLTVGQDGDVKLGDKSGYTDSSSVDDEPKCSAHDSGLLAIGCMQKLVLHRNGAVCDSLDLDFRPICLDMKNNELIVAGEGKARRFNTTGGKLKDLGDLDIKGGASSVKFNPDGSLLAAGDLQDKALRLFDVEAGYKLKVSNFPHSTKVMTMAWSPDGKYLASGCLDQAVAVWNTTVGKRKAVVKHAHRLSHVNSLTWLDENKLVSAGHDGHLKIWEASF